MPREQKYDGGRDHRDHSFNKNFRYLVPNIMPRYRECHYSRNFTVHAIRF